MLLSYTYLTPLLVLASPLVPIPLLEPVPLWNRFRIQLFWSTSNLDSDSSKNWNHTTLSWQSTRTQWSHASLHHTWMENGISGSMGCYRYKSDWGGRLSPLMPREFFITADSRIEQKSVSCNIGWIGTPHFYLRFKVSIACVARSKSPRDAFSEPAW